MKNLPPRSKVHLLRLLPLQNHNCLLKFSLYFSQPHIVLLSPYFEIETLNNSKILKKGGQIGEGIQARNPKPQIDRDEGAKRKKICTEGITWLMASNAAVLCQISPCLIRGWPRMAPISAQTRPTRCCTFSFKLPRLKCFALIYMIFHLNKRLFCLSLMNFSIQVYL